MLVAASMQGRWKAPVSASLAHEVRSVTKMGSQCSVRHPSQDALGLSDAVFPNRAFT